MIQTGLRAAATWTRKLAVGGLVVVLLIVNLRLYSPASHPAGHDQVNSHLRFVAGAIDDGLAQDMQAQFPEGYFFTHALYGLTWVEIGLQPDAAETVRLDALAAARSSLAAIDSPAGRAPFSAALEPAYGGFYVGWSNYLRAGIVALQVRALGTDADAAELAALQRECDAILDALDEIDSPYLPSYPGETWPVDTYPAMVSVQACAEFVNPAYQQEIDEWLLATDAASDPDHGLIGHRHEPFREHPRATSQTMILRFLAELDPDRAATEYSRFRQDFVVSRLGLPAVREHPRGIDAPGDVDSGPLITGVSLSASVVAIGAAQVNGDQEMATALRQAGQAFGFPLPLPGGRRYAAGVLPIGDLFVVWSSAAHLWFQPPPAVIDSPMGWSWHWRLPTHGVSLAGGALAGFALWPGTRQRARQLAAAVTAARPIPRPTQ